MQKFENISVHLVFKNWILQEIHDSEKCDKTYAFFDELEVQYFINFSRTRVISWYSDTV
jgi:hypothetical protein